jgi:hypothetical protein
MKSLITQRMLHGYDYTPTASAGNPEPLGVVTASAGDWELAGIAVALLEVPKFMSFMHGTVVF